MGSISGHAGLLPSTVGARRRRLGNVEAAMKCFEAALEAQKGPKWEPPGREPPQKSRNIIGIYSAGSLCSYSSPTIYGNGGPKRPHKEQDLTFWRQGQPYQKPCFIGS